MGSYKKTAIAVGAAALLAVSAIGPVAAQDEATEEDALARVLAKGHTALFPVDGPPGRGSDASINGRWMMDPGTTVYYAIATDNATDARRIAALVERLPVSCGGRTTHGLKAYELQQWLEALSRLLLELGPRADWQSLAMQAGPGEFT